MSETDKKKGSWVFFYPVGILLLIGLIYLILYLTGVFDGDKIILSPKPLPPIVKVGSGLAAVPAVITVPAAKSASTIGPAAASGSSSTLATPAKIPNTNEMINIVDQHIPLPAPAIIKSNSGTLASYKVYTGDIAGFDISKGEIGSLTFDQIADICTNRPFCNTFVISGNEYYLKNIPDGLVTTGNSSMVFTKAKITSSIPSKMSEYSLYMDCNVDNYDIPGYNDSSSGMDMNELADLCYSIPNCNTVQGNKGMRKFKNVPDGATCSYESRTTTFSRAKNLNKPF
jgi:hypothetical protein